MSEECNYARKRKMNKGEGGFSCGVVFRHLFNVGGFLEGFPPRSVYRS